MGRQYWSTCIQVSVHTKNTSKEAILTKLTMTYKAVQIGHGMGGGPREMVQGVKDHGRWKYQVLKLHGIN